MSSNTGSGGSVVCRESSIDLRDVICGAAWVPHHGSVKNACILCQRTSDTVPLLTLEYRSETFRVCSQHLPVLIHDPAQMIGLIDGADQFRPSEHRD